MKKNKYITESFINAITKEVSILIAANDHMSIEKAENLFKESKVYNFLCFPPDYFYEEDPQYFYEMYENLEHKGLMVDNNQLYLMQNPQLYKLPTD